MRRLAGRGDRAVAYVGVPALDGTTWPLRRYSAPTLTSPYVCAVKLGAVPGAGCRRR
ncbi:hypothetical protein GCM10019016_076270 [Streptomyces prasinosporus]|uniref:Uncharacterized protein n=1 Tax=Streptomyces prasinosporus TaxID=68256 RepID=A0ABP6U1V1_9ACTN